MAFIKKPLILLVLLLILAVAGGVFFYTQYQNAQTELKKLKENPRDGAAEETKKLIDKVGTLVALPQGEDPAVATITDVKKLTDQPFFAKAANGDKVLIYTQGKRAILYRPSTNKVIDIAPVNIGSGSATTTAAAKQSLTKVAIYNGTKTVGLTKVAEEELKKKAVDVEVIAKENASKNDYEGSMVIAIAKNKDKEAKAIADALGAEVSSMPEGETAPAGAEILIILGADYVK